MPIYRLFVQYIRSDITLTHLIRHACFACGHHPLLYSSLRINFGSEKKHTHTFKHQPKYFISLLIRLHTCALLLYSMGFGVFFGKQIINVFFISFVLFLYVCLSVVRCYFCTMCMFCCSRVHQSKSSTKRNCTENRAKSGRKSNRSF